MTQTVTASAPIPIYSEGERFYVPYFEVRIGAHPLRVPEDIMHDVMQVTYHDSIQEIDSFELTLNNWDAQYHDFKYEPAQADQIEGIFDPGQRLELWMGYMGNLRLMLRGEITSLEPHFPESGGPTLAVRGLNRLHAFRKKQHTDAWEKRRPSEIALDIARRPVTDDHPGLGLGADGIRVRDDYKKSEVPEDFVFMNNQYDIVFLLQLARKQNYSVYMEVNPETGKERLYFGPAEAVRDITYELQWGLSMISFQPTLTTARQVSSVTVRGWNRKTGKPIEHTAKLGDKDVKINQDLDVVALAVAGRQEIIVDQPVFTKEEARRLAIARLSQRQEEICKANAATVGLPDLRAGSKVHIKKLGARFSGVYYVMDTTHTIGDSGYRTTFNARREAGLEEA